MNIALKRALQLLTLTITTFFAACILIHLCQMAYDRVPTYTDGKATDEPARTAKGTEPRFTFDDLLDAIEWVESKGIETAVGDNGLAVGAYQLHNIYVKDYHRITKNKKRFVLSDPDLRLDAFWSRVITKTVTQHYAHHDHPELDVDDMKFLEKAARTHNSPANRNNSKTDAYWALVFDRMESQK